MSLRARVSQIAFQVATGVTNRVSDTSNKQRSNDQQTMGLVVGVVGNQATVEMPDGSTQVGTISTRTVTEGDVVSIFGGRIL